MRRTFLVAACFAAVLPVVVWAQSSAPVDPNRKAYGYTLLCAATAAGVYTDPHSTAAQKAAASASYDRAADAAFRMGRVLQLSDEKVRQDMLATTRREASLQLRSAAYLSQSKEQCARLGM